MCGIAGYFGKGSIMQIYQYLFQKTQFIEFKDIYVRFNLKFGGYKFVGNHTS